MECKNYACIQINLYVHPTFRLFCEKWHTVTYTLFFCEYLAAAAVGLIPLCFPNIF